MEEPVRPDSEQTNFLISVTCHEDFYTGEDLEAILEATDEENWDKDVEFIAEAVVLMRNIEEEPSKSGFKGKKCEKLCKSKQGLSRHQNSKHRYVQPEQEEGGTSTAVEKRFSPVYFKDYINHCATGRYLMPTIQMRPLLYSTLINVAWMIRCTDISLSEML